MLLSGLLKTTLLDYPEHVAATIFLGGCNMCCPFCHNKSLVLSAVSTYSLEEIINFLSKRAGILDGVCISGGEPTIYPELSKLLLPIKALGYSIKLDTNGTNPNMLSSLISQGLIDYVAMDIKLPFQDYKKTLNYNGSVENLFQSLALLKSDVIPYELRTTVVNELHNVENIHAMGAQITGAKKLYLQNFVNSSDVIVPDFHPVSEKTLKDYQKILKTYVSATYIRGEQSSSNNSTLLT